MCTEKIPKNLFRTHIPSNFISPSLLFLLKSNCLSGTVEQGNPQTRYSFRHAWTQPVFRKIIVFNLAEEGMGAKMNRRGQNLFVNGQLLFFSVIIEHSWSILSSG